MKLLHKKTSRKIISNFNLSHFVSYNKHSISFRYLSSE